MERLAVSASMWSDLKLEEKKTMELVRLIFSPDTSLKGVQSMDDCVTILGVNSCKYSQVINKENVRDLRARLANTDWYPLFGIDCIVKEHEKPFYALDGE